MAGQQFCLRWNNHQPNFVSVFTSLLNNESLVDVTLAAEGKHLQAHRVVLSACSAYFQTLFAVNPCQHPIVILKDVKYEDLKTVVDFMYYGEVNVSQEQLAAVLKTAETLKIKGLADVPSKDVKNFQSVDAAAASPAAVQSQNSLRHQPSQEAVNDSMVPHPSVRQQSSQEAASPTDAVNKRSASPVSPYTEQMKRFRRKSGESNSGSAERVDDESSLDARISASPAPVSVKSEPEVSLQETESFSRPSFHRSSFSEHSPGSFSLNTELESRDISQDHHNEPPKMSTCQESGTSCLSQSDDHMAGTSSSVPMASQSQVMYSGTPGPSFFGGKEVNDVHRLYNSTAHLFLGPVTKFRVPDGKTIRIRKGTPQNFMQAIEAVRQGKISFMGAEKLYGINHMTLYRHYRRLGYPIHRKSMNPNFNKPKEER